MVRKIYTDGQVEQVRQEFLSYRAKYVVACRINVGHRIAPLDQLYPKDARKLLDLSHRLTDYYVHRKTWDSYEDFERAMREASPFSGRFHHMMSVAIRLVKIRGQRREPSANKLLFKKSGEKSMVFGGCRE